MLCLLLLVLMQENAFFMLLNTFLIRAVMLTVVSVFYRWEYIQMHERQLKCWVIIITWLVISLSKLQLRGDGMYS